MQVIDFYFAVEFDYSLVTVPEIYKDIGHATINVQPFKISLGMTTKVENNTLSVDLQSFSYHFVDYTVEFTGNGDLSFLIMSVAESLKPLILADLSPNIEVVFENMLIPQINNMLKNIQTSIDIEGVTVDMAFMDHPQFSPNDYNIVLKGEVRPTGGSEPPFVDDRLVPANYDPSGGFVQVFLSDYVIKSLLYTVYQTNVIDIKYDDNPLTGGKLTVGLVKYLIIDLKKSFSDDTIFFIDVNTEDTPIPDFDIIDGETYVGLRLNILLGVTSQGNDIKVASMTVRINLTLNYELVGGTALKATISSFEMKVVGDVKNYLPDIIVNTDDFNSVLGLAPGLVRNFVNYALGELQIPIPEIPYVNLNLNQTYIDEKDRYLLFRTSPKITFKSGEKHNFVFNPPPYDASKSYKKHLTSEEAKVEFFKRFVKATPLMGILEEAKKLKKQQEKIGINPELFGMSFRKPRGRDGYEESSDHIAHTPLEQMTE